MARDLGKDKNGFRQSLQQLSAKVEAITKEGSKALRAAGLELEGAIKLQLSKHGSGQIYVRGGTTHQASAPGEPPAPDTGALRASVGQELFGRVLRVGVGMPYAVFLEFGTIDANGHIEPRPFMRPALAECKERMTGVVVADLRRGGLT